MKIKNFIDKDFQCNSFTINEKYKIFVEVLEPIDNEEDILVEVFENGECLFNCLKYKGHNFTSETNMNEVEDYVKEVIELYEADK